AAGSGRPRQFGSGPGHSYGGSSFHGRLLPARWQCAHRAVTSGFTEGPFLRTIRSLQIDKGGAPMRTRQHQSPRCERGRQCSPPTVPVALTTLLACVVVVSTPALAQSGAEILQTANARYLERVAAIADYTVVQEVGGTAATVHHEKRIVDGFPVFVPVSTFTLLQERIDAQKMSFLEGALQAGLQSLITELSNTSYAQMGELLNTLTEVGRS